MAMVSYSATLLPQEIKRSPGPQQIKSPPECTCYDIK